LAVRQIRGSNCAPHERRGDRVCGNRVRANEGIPLLPSSVFAACAMVVSLMSWIPRKRRKAAGPGERQIDKLRMHCEVAIEWQERLSTFLSSTEATVGRRPHGVDHGR
jgi:hypothetical protein